MYTGLHKCFQAQHTCCNSLHILLDLHHWFGILKKKKNIKHYVKFNGRSLNKRTEPLYWLLPLIIPNISNTFIMHCSISSENLINQNKLNETVTPIDISLKCHHWSAWKYDDHLKRNHPFSHSKRLRGYRVNAPRFVAAKISTCYTQIRPRKYLALNLE